jgi:hypothetical protein
MKRYPRLRLLLAVSAMVVVSLIALAAVPDATARPCPPPPTLTECQSLCAPSIHGPGGTICYLTACTTCPRLVCAYGC